MTSEVIPQIARTGNYIPNDNPAFNPLKEDFTKREKVEILMKLLNFPNLPNPLRNDIIRHVNLILSPDYGNFWENLLEQNAD